MSSTHSLPSVGSGAARRSHEQSSSLALILALAVIFLPMYWELAANTWSSDSQGHAPIILALSMWLIYRERHAIMAAPERPAYFLGFGMLLVGLGMYAVGKSQAMITVEVASQPFVYAAVVLILKGPAALRLVWFPLVFLLFTVPLPGVFVQAITVPLKIAVSTVAEFVLYHTGYPIARTGVILSIGQYQLLVADACSGLASIFTLEALGLLYMKLMNYTSALRNTFLAIAVIPIAFIANVARVVILVLVTYYLGDEVGQGFMHGFAGMVLFLLGLGMLLGLDGLISALLRDKSATPVRQAETI